MQSKIKDILYNVILIILGVALTHILNLALSFINPFPDMSIQSYFWNAVQITIQLFPLCIVCGIISLLSRRYAKMNTLIIGTLFLCLHSITLSVFYIPIIPQLHYSMMALVVLTLPSAYFGYFLSQKLLGIPTKI